MGQVDSRCVGIAVLGPLSIDGVASVLGRRDRAVLSALAVRPGEVLSADQLAEVLWQDEPPASWAKVVQGCVVRLRKVLGPGSIETLPSGYRLTLAHDQIDAQRFERATERARALLNGSDDADRAAFVLGEALSLWRGQALGDVEDWGPGRIEAGRLDELHREAEELYVEASLRIWALGEGAGSRPDLGARAAVARTTLGTARAGAVPGRTAERGADHPAPGPEGVQPGPRRRPGPGARPARAGDVAPGSGAVRARAAAGAERGVPLPRPAPLRHRQRGHVLRALRRRGRVSAAAQRHSRARRGRPLRLRQVVDGAGGRGGRLAAGRTRRHGPDARPAPDRGDRDASPSSRLHHPRRRPVRGGVLPVRGRRRAGALPGRPGRAGGRPVPWSWRSAPTTWWMSPRTAASPASSRAGCT